MSMIYSPEQIQEALERAIKFFEEHPERWLRLDLAKSKKGRLCSPFHPNAHCFCALGRFAHELGQLPDSEIRGYDEGRPYEVGYAESYAALGVSRTWQITSKNDNHEDHIAALRAQLQKNA